MVTYLNHNENQMGSIPIVATNIWGVVQARPNYFASSSEKRGSIPLRSTKRRNSINSLCVFDREDDGSRLLICRGNSTTGSNPVGHAKILTINEL